MHCLSLHVHVLREGGTQNSNSAFVELVLVGEEVQGLYQGGACVVQVDWQSDLWAGFS